MYAYIRDLDWGSKLIDSVTSGVSSRDLCLDFCVSRTADISRRKKYYLYVTMILLNYQKLRPLSSSTGAT